MKERLLKWTGVQCIILALIIFVAVSGNAMPPPATSYIAEEDNPVTLMIGIKYDESMIGVIGSVMPMGNRFYSTAYTQMGGLGGSVNLETMYLFSTAGFYFGPLLGPNVDWINEENDGVRPVAYFVGATGFVAGYAFNDDVGLWGAIKYKYSFDDANMYPDGYEFGVGLNISL